MLLAVCVSPYGIQNALVPFDTFGMRVLKEFVEEWKPLTLDYFQAYLFVAMIVLTIGLAWKSRATWDTTRFLWFAGTLFLAFDAGRNVSLFAVASLPLTDRLAAEIFDRSGIVITQTGNIGRSKGVLNLLIVSLLTLVVIVTTINVTQTATIEKERRLRLPIDAIEYIQQNQPSGVLFNHYNFGGTIIWYLPDYPVFIDGRTDLYRDFVTDYTRIYQTQQGWENKLAGYNIGLVLIPSEATMSKTLGVSDAWCKLYEDDIAVIYQRTDESESLCTAR